MSSIPGEFVTETFDYDGGRQVTAYVQLRPPEAVVFAGDGQLISRWGPDLEAAKDPSTMIVGVHRPACRPHRSVRGLGRRRARTGLGLRHPDIYGVLFCASPGAGYRPPAPMPSPLPRAGTHEPFFLENATRWADALRDAGADVVITERVGSHGDPFWREELPRMVAWAFGR
jgi:hypothetical protein